jgi:hypothetical protein
MPVYSNIYSIRYLMNSQECRNYRLLKNGSYLDVILICLSLYKLIIFSMFSKRFNIIRANLLLIEGDNQSRLFNNLVDGGSSGSLFYNISLKDITTFSRLPVSFFSSINLLMLLCIICLTKSQRFYLLFHYLYYFSIAEEAGKYKISLERFITFNEKTLLSSSLVLFFNTNEVKTVTIQHGIIFRSYAYFPSASREFWAWGNAVSNYYSSFNNFGDLIIKGRNLNDVSFTPINVSDLGERCSVIIGVGYRWNEVLSTLVEIFSKSSDFGTSPNFNIKFHPSTRFKILLTLLIKFKYPRVNIFSDWIEKNVDKFDILVTRNSTLVFDFIIHGRIVLLSYPLPVYDINNYCFPLRGFSLYNFSSSALALKRNILVKRYLNIHF